MVFIFLSQVDFNVVAGATACCLLAALYCRSAFITQTPRIVRAPSQKVTRQIDDDTGGDESRSYLPTSLPGGRNVETPYGVIRVYEWGPKTGRKVLLLCGISTPAVALSDLASALVEKSCRVMLFDYFGRGYSDAPTNVPHDVDLYLTQILLVLSSSEIPWTGNKSFSIVGYSFGGASSMALAEYSPNLIDSITLVAPSGLVRDYHVGWQARLIYQGGWLPGDIRRALVKRRLYIPPPPASLSDQNGTFRVGSSDATSGPDYDYAAISKKTPAVTVSDVLNWQITNHPGFVDAFISCINYAPIFNQNDSWTSVGNTLRERRQADTTDTETNKVLLILGTSDPSIVTEEIIADATASLGEDGVNLIVLDGGHEIAITQGVKIADILSSHLVASTDQ